MGEREGGGRRSRSTYTAGAASGNPERALMRGRVCVVTGATRGIGRAAALGLARLGATVVVVARDGDAPGRVQAVADELRGAGAADAVPIVANLASLDAVRGAAAEIARRFEAVHVLVHNAGVSLARRHVTPDGREATLAINHLAPFLLTKLLLPRLRAGTPSRIITVSSELEGWGGIDFDDLQSARRYHGTGAYLRSKLANVLFTYSLAERLAGSGVTANCVYPGLVATDLLRERWWWRARWLRPIWRRIFRTPEEGARTIVWLASSPKVEGVTGQCFRDERPVSTSKRSRDRVARERLWRVSEELTGA